MKEKEIKIGDTVKVTANSRVKGKTGVVRRIYSSKRWEKLYGVNFDGDSFRWVFSDREIEKVKLEKMSPCIVVYREGDTVTVKDLVTGEEASAVCSKKDTFDIYTGVFIAMSRLTGYADMLPVMTRDIELMERDLADLKNRVKAMMGDGDMWLHDDSFLRR